MSSPVGSPACVPKRSFALENVSQKALSDAETAPPPEDALAPLDVLASLEADAAADATAEATVDALLPAADGVPPLLLPPQAASASAAASRTGTRARGVFMIGVWQGRRTVAHSSAPRGTGS